VKKTFSDSYLNRSVYNILFSRRYNQASGRKGTGNFFFFLKREKESSSGCTNVFNCKEARAMGPLLERGEETGRTWSIIFLLAKSQKKNENYSLLVLSLVWTPATFCIPSPMTPEEFTTIHVFDHMQSLAQHRMGQRLAVCCHSYIEKCGDVRPKALFHSCVLFIMTADRMSRVQSSWNMNAHPLPALFAHWIPALSYPSINFGRSHLNVCLCRLFFSLYRLADGRSDFHIL